VLDGKTGIEYVIVMPSFFIDTTMASNKDAVFLALQIVTWSGLLMSICSMVLDEVGSWRWVGGQGLLDVQITTRPVCLG
jgi:hypothetical protein